MTSLTGCKWLLEDNNKKPPVEDYRNGSNQGDYRNGGDYRSGGYYQGDNRNGDYRGNDYRGGNNTDYRSGANNGYNNGNRGNNYPQMGSTVTSLGVRNPQKVVVHGETLYVVNGVYYKAVRSGSNTVYQVVGYQQN